MIWTIYNFFKESMIKKPKDVEEARDALSKQLNNHVGSAYGFINILAGKDIGWHLIVWSDDKNIQFPSVFKGFKVTRRGVPVILEEDEK